MHHACVQAASPKHVTSAHVCTSPSSKQMVAPDKACVVPTPIFNWKRPETSTGAVLDEKEELDTGLEFMHQVLN